MAGIDKIYGTQQQFNELKEWLIKNQRPIKCLDSFEWDDKDNEVKNYEDVLPTDCLYNELGYPKNHRPISNFPENIDMWLLKNCPIKWVISRIKEQYDLK